MAKLRIQTNEEMQDFLAYELKYNRDKRLNLELEWTVTENIYQAISGRMNEGGVDADSAIREVYQRKTSAEDKPVLQSTMLARAMFFLHSKLCITEPDVVARPFKRDYETKKAAELAQLWVEHIKRVTNLQETLEAGPYLNTVTKGTGIAYVGWDKHTGEPLIADPERFNPETDEFLMTGEVVIRNVSPRDFFIDSTAKHFKDAKNCIERLTISAQEFIYLFPDKRDILNDLLEKESSGDYRISEGKRKSKNSVDLYFYWEKALPWNGMLGTYIVFVETSREEKSIEILERSEHPYKHKELPYAVISDLDIDENPFGMSRAVHCAHHLDIVNLFMSLIIENVEICGIPRVIAPEGSTDDALKTADIAKIIYYNPASGGQIYHLKPSAITTDVWRMIDIVKSEIDSVYGQGEFSRGEIPRELSSYAVQLGIEMDDKFRIRLFNKKRQFLNTIYCHALSLVQQYCKEPRKLQVIGNENIYKDEYFMAENTMGDYGIYVEYGKYMPIDPSARKQMLLEIVNNGAYERAGGNLRKIFKILLDGDMFDLTEVFNQAVRTQESEIVDILEADREVAVMPWQEHPAHMEALQDLFQQQFFEKLPNKMKTKLWKHYTEHENAQAKLEAEAAKNQPQPAAGGGVPNANMSPAQPGTPVDAGGQGVMPQM